MSQQTDSDILTQETVDTLKEPPMVSVVLLNDDYTPMDFVVAILCEYFHKDIDTATAIMYQVHNEGRGIAGVYTPGIAETKAAQVIARAQSEGHPLRCITENL